SFNPARLTLSSTRGCRKAVKSESKVSDSTGGSSKAADGVGTPGTVAGAGTTAGADAGGGAGASAAAASFRRDQRESEKRSAAPAFAGIACVLPPVHRGGLHRPRIAPCA